MNLDVQKWQYFYLHRLFDIRMGNKFDKNKLDVDTPEVNLVSRVSYNNGVDTKVGYVEGVQPFPAGCVTVALGGSYLGSCFVQYEQFYTSQNVAVMKPRILEMTRAVCTFISGLVRYESKTKYYAFGRELNTHIKTDFNVKLPVQSNSDGSPFIDTSCKFSDDGFVPDWQFMEDYIKSLHYKPLSTGIRMQRMSLGIDKWREFKISAILSIHNGKGITTEEIEENPGDLNAVQSGEDNNGVIGKIDRDYCYSKGYTVSEKPCLTVARSGSAGFVSFQVDGCVVGDSAKLLLLEDEVANVYVYLFIQTLLMANRFKYAYGRKVTEENYLSDTIKLPIQYDNTKPVKDNTYRFSKSGFIPDWEFMENYIKSLPYGDRI